jgi:hypothetical protein
MTRAVVLCASDLAHGVVKGQTENLNMEVNGVAGEVAFRPAPVAVFDDETGIGWQNKIASFARDDLDRVAGAAAPAMRAGRRGFARATSEWWLSART